MKHSFEDELIKELEALDHSFQPSTMQKEKMKRNVFQGQNTKFSKTQNWLPAITSIIVIFSIGFGMFTLLGSELGFNINSDKQKNQEIVSQGVTLEGELLSKISFKDKIKFLDKTSLPFEIEFILEEIGSLPNKEQVFHMFYMNKSKGNLLELQVTDANVIPQGNLTDIHLNGNRNAKYSTNGIVEILSWKEDGLSYMLISRNTEDQSLGIEKLVEIVEKMK